MSPSGTVAGEDHLPDATMIRTCIENELRRRNWTRYRFAQEMQARAGVSVSTVYGWLRGDRGVSVEVLEAMMRVLGAKGMDLRIPDSAREELTEPTPSGPD